MSFREVNENDILKEWLNAREEGLLGNVPKQNKEFVKKQLNKLDENFLDYLGYWN